MLCLGAIWFESFSCSSCDSWFKMIVTKLFCGLGNQMFQYAAGLALAQRRNTISKLDVSWFSEQNAEANHERYGLDCFVLDAHFVTE